MEPTTIEGQEEEEERASRRSDLRGRALVLAFAIAAVFFLYQLATGGLGASLPEVGSEAADLELQMLDAEPIHLAELRGRVVLLDFWATWCPPCVESMPAVERISREMEGVVAVAVNRDEQELETRKTLIRRFLDKHELDGLQVALDDGRAAGAFRVRGLPTLVVLDREGKVAAAHLGAIDEDGLRKLVEPVVAQAAPASGS